MSSRQVLNYGVREFDLTTSRTNERIDVNASEITILRADDSVKLRIGDPQSAPIDLRRLESIKIPEGIRQLYLTNSSGTGRLEILFGISGVDASAGGSEIEGIVDVEDRSAREIGKARLEDKGGKLINPASEATLSSTLSREIAQWNAGTLNVDTEFTEPFDVSASTVDVDPDPSILTASTSNTGSSNAAEIQLGKKRVAFDVAYDLSGSATITVEVSSDGTTWRTFQTVNSSGTNSTLTEDTAFEYVRAYADQNLNTLEMSSKGV